MPSDASPLVIIRPIPFEVSFVSQCRPLRLRRNPPGPFPYLAGSVIGMVFNNIGAMFGSIFLFIPIFLIGHALNLAMCCLGAFVHPLRLNFLEFFKNSGYEGKGTRYNPIINNN